MIGQVSSFGVGSTLIKVITVFFLLAFMFVTILVERLDWPK